VYKIKGGVHLKKWAIGLLALGLLVGCSDSETTKEKEEVKVESTEVEEEVTETTTEVVEEEVVEEEVNIDTSVFVYAEDVEITDARDTNKHLTLVVHMSEETKTGMAAQHVLTQAYDFLQQKDIEGADTITIGVMQADTRILQLTINVKEFVPIDTESMAKCVLRASTIEKLVPEVDDYGKTMGLW
jgi:hypothetical protein